MSIVKTNVNLKKKTQVYYSLLKRGEYVLVVDGAGEQENPLNILSPEEHIRHYMAAGLPKKEALKKAAKDRGVSKSDLYQYSLDL